MWYRAPSGVEKKYLAGLITPSRRCNSGPRNTYEKERLETLFFVERVSISWYSWQTAYAGVAQVVRAKDS